MNYLLAFFSSFAHQALAADNAVNLLQPLDTSDSGKSISSVGQYISIAFPVFLGVAVTLSVVMITWGGLEYILSKVPGAKVEGKDRIKGALWGLALALVAWVILNTINPAINTLGIFKDL